MFVVSRKSESAEHVGHRTIKTRIITGGAWALGGKAVAIVLALMLNIVLARLLSPEDMGLYFIALSLVNILALVAQLGLGHAVIRLVAQSVGSGEYGRAKSAVAMVLISGLVSGVFAALLLSFGGGRWVALGIFGSPHLAAAMQLIGGLVLVMVIQNLMAESFRGFHDMKYAAIFDGVLANVIASVFFGLWWFYSVNTVLTDVMIVLVASGFLGILTAGYFLWRKVSEIGRLRGQECLKWRELFFVSSPMWVTGVISLAVAQVGIWMTGAFLSSSDVAIYGAAARLVGLLTIAMAVINSVVQPMIAELYGQRQTEKLEVVLRSTATIAGVPAMLLLAIFSVAGASVLEVVYGQEYRSGAGVLAILSIGQMVNVWAGSSGATLMMTANQRSIVSVTLVAGLIMVTSGWCLVTRFGTQGVAMASALGISVQAIGMLVSAKKNVDVWTHMSIRALGRLIFERHWG